MSYNLNRVCLSGNLTRDPVLRQISEGKSVVNFGLAVNKSYRSRDGQIVEKTSFFDVTAWGSVAESTAKYAAKGDSVIVDGELQQDKWDGKDGKKESRVKVIASRVCFVSGSRPARKPGPDVDRPAPDSAAVPF